MIYDFILITPVEMLSIRVIMDIKAIRDIPDGVSTLNLDILYISFWWTLLQCEQTHAYMYVITLFR